MWLVLFDKKRDVDVFVYVVLCEYVLLIKPGIETKHVFVANKKQVQRAITSFDQFFHSNSLSRLVLGAIWSSWREGDLITKNLRDAGYHNT